MTHKLPPNLLALFSARPPLRYLPAADYAVEDRRTTRIEGLAAFLPALEEYKASVPYEPTESWLQRKDRIKQEKKANELKLLEEGLRRDANDDPNVRGDAFKTLFIARLSYEATEKDLEREFGRFGPIERIRVVTGKRLLSNGTNGNSADHGSETAGPRKKIKAHKGYAFVVFEREKDMKAARKETDGMRIKDRRIIVDVERGRTVKGWQSRRIGGGLGGRGYTKAPVARPTGFGAGSGFAGQGTGANVGPGGFGGGFRGGFRGGFDRGMRGGGRGGGGFREGNDRGGGSSYGGGRGGGIGYQGSGGGGGGFGARGGYGAPPNAPSGPGGRGGGGGGGYGSGGGYDSRRGDSGDRYSHRDGGHGGGFRDQGRHRDERDRGYRSRDDDHDRKRPHDGPDSEDPRKIRRY